MAVTTWPNIDSINDLRSPFREHCVAIFKCNGAEWVELITQTVGSVVGSQTFQASTLGGYETVHTGTQAFNFALTDLDPRIKSGAPFSVLAATTDAASTQIVTSLCSIMDVDSEAGWILKGEQYNNTGATGFTKWAVTDASYSNLTTDGVESFIGTIVRDDNSAYGITDEGGQADANTGAITTTGTDRFSIGVFTRNNSSIDYYYGNIGPYIFLFEQALEEEYFLNAARDPSSIVRSPLLDQIEHYHGKVSGAFTLTANSGSYTYSGTAAALEFGANLSADSGSYTYSGTAADLNYGFVIAGDSGTYTYTGTNAELDADFVLDANSGTYTYSGTAADLDRGYYLAGDSGTYTYSGTDATLTFESPGAFTLSANTGTYTYSGTNAELDAGLVVDATSGTYTYSGTTVALTRGFTLSADSGSYTYTGTAIAFDLTAILSATSGTYAYTGSNATLTSSGQIWTIQGNDNSSWTIQSNDSSTWTIQ